MNRSPLVSVITTTYIDENRVESFIKSLLNQRYQNYEYIIIDGASNNSAIYILKKYIDKITFWLNEPYSGLYQTWNKALLRCKGNWILFIGADKQLLPNAIKTCINSVSVDTSHSMEYVSSRPQRINSNGTARKVVAKAWEWAKFKKRMTTPHSGSCHSRTFFQRYGTYKTKFRIVANYEILLRAKSVLCASFINKVTVRMALSQRFQESAALVEVIERFHDSKHLPVLQRQIHRLNLLCRYQLKRFLPLK